MFDDVCEGAEVCDEVVEIGVQVVHVAPVLLLRLHPLLVEALRRGAPGARQRCVDNRNASPFSAQQ